MEIYKDQMSVTVSVMLVIEICDQHFKFKLAVQYRAGLSGPKPRAAAHGLADLRRQEKQTESSRRNSKKPSPTPTNKTALITICRL